MSVGVAIGVHSAGPAPVGSATLTQHVIATTIFFCWCTALGAASHCADGLPGPESDVAFTLGAPATVPFVSALEAHGLAALAGCLIAAPARLAHCQAAFRPRTPLQILVLANLDVLSNRFVCLLNFSRTELLDVAVFEHLLAVFGHAGNLLSPAVLDERREVGACAILAETVTADQSIEVLRPVHLVACLARLTT